MSRLGLRSALAAGALLLAAAPAAWSGGRAGGLTVYFKQRLGSKGPPGQIAPVLMPVRRDRRALFSPRVQVMDELSRGPSSDERARGFLVMLAGGTKWRSVAINHGVATVQLTGKAPDVYGSAAIVYSLTQLSGVRGVRLRLEHKPCCVYDMRNRPIRLLTRRTFRGWQGEPCPFRTYPGAVRCRRG